MEEKLPSIMKRQYFDQIYQSQFFWNFQGQRVRLDDTCAKVISPVSRDSYMMPVNPKVFQQLGIYEL
jgi:hypothetical protein